MVQTAERISQYETSDKVIFERSVFAYIEAAKLASGHLLEIGCGMGYGIETLLPCVTNYTALDKFISEPVKQFSDKEEFNFIQTKIPPLSDIESNSIDTVVSFQVIEHIKNDKYFTEEIFRVLKPGGKALLTTPNKKMSLTRNPWHIREYTVGGLQLLFERNFNKINIFGVYGNDKVDNYYLQNKESVKRITRFDIFNFQYLLPRFLLQIPYDILNRINRNKLLSNNNELVKDISHSDYHLKPADDNCYDLFIVVEK